MGKIKMRYTILVFVLVAMFKGQLYSQSYWTQELDWGVSKYYEDLYFYDTVQILEWHGESRRVKAFRQNIDEFDVFVISVNNCSGIFCPFIFMFVKIDKRWYLVDESSAKLRSSIAVEFDCDNEIIIFKTDNVTISKYPFEKLKRNISERISENKKIQN